MTQKTEHFKTIATKVSNQAYQLLDRLARKHGMKIYQLLQMCADTLIRYMSDRHNLTPEMERAMGVFEHMTGWRDAFNLADHTTEGRQRIDEAVYFLSAEGKRGARAVMVRRPFMGQWQQDENAQHIIERTIELTAPEIYRRLRSLAVDMECSSILELLNHMIDANDIRQLDIAEIRQGFEDCRRAENNRPLAYGERTRRKKHHSPEEMEQPRQATIHFSPSDVPDLPELHEHEGEDFDIVDGPIGW